MATSLEVPCFFLSYARADADDFFNRFYEDFLEELRGQLGEHTVDGLGFRDSEDISLGAPWKPEIERALLNCRTFFAMLSPTYLTRPECRREWAGFDWRLATYGPPAAPHPLLPVIWRPIPDHKLPPEIQRRQYKHAALGPDYAARGLRYLAQRPRSSRYRDFLAALAEDVCAVVSQPASSPPFSLPEPSRLGDPLAIATLPSATVSPIRTSGPGHVEFILVAGSEIEIRAVRQAVAAYGACIDDWCPYLPVREDRATVLVQQIAIQEKFSTGRSSIPQNIVAHIERARDSNTLIVLVVDAWSLMLSAYRLCMQTFDAARLINAGVLVLWNCADQETLSKKQELSGALHAAFRNLGAQGDPLAFHAQLNTPEVLDEKLRVTLHELRRRIIAFGTPTRMAEGANTIHQPRISGPGGA